MEVNSPAETWLGLLTIDPLTTNTLYVVTGKGVFRSTDGGESWSAVNTGLTAFSVYTLAIDAQNPKRLYAGTSAGVYEITFVP